MIEKRDPPPPQKKRKKKEKKEKKQEKKRRKKKEKKGKHKPPISSDHLYKEEALRGPGCTMAMYLEVLAGRLVVHDVGLAVAAERDLLAGRALVDADARDANGPGGVPNRHTHVDVVRLEVVALAHELRGSICVRRSGCWAA